MSGSMTRRMRTWTAAFVAVAVTAAIPAGADTFYVNGSCGNDGWSGTSSDCSAPDGPKLTIQAGIDASVNGDAVIVADGTYMGVGNKNLDYGGRLITLQSENGAATCIIDCEAEGRGFHFRQTGVEMEALCAVSVAALTVYDMCKAVDRGIRIADIRLTHKAGGKSGTYEAE